MSRSSFIKTVFYRRVPQILGLYLAAAWIGVEFSDLIVDRYLLSSTLIDFLLVLFASFLPTVLMLAWFHGAPGRDEWTLTEQIGIPVNLVFSVVLLFMLFQGKELGATTTTVTVTDEEGQKVERIVAKQELRKRMAVFFLDNKTGDIELDWLQYVLAVAIATDLDQNIFVHVWTPYREFEKRGFEDLEKAGFADGLKVPVALKRAIARKKRREYFVSGSFDKIDDEYALQVDVYETERAKIAFSKRLTGPDVLLLADRLSDEIKAAIDVPDTETGNDLGITERIAGSSAAIRLAVLGLNAEYLENDLSKAVEYWRQAVDLDPGFARVHMLMANAIFQLGNMEAASDAIRKALQHEYRLTDDDRFIAKALSYTWRNEPEKSLKLYEMWVELYPQNTRARKHLANAYLSQINQPRDALAQLEIVYKLDPDDDGVLLYMARIHEVLGELDEAISKYKQYAENNPEDQTALINMAATLINAGELQAARESYERAGLFASELIRPMVGLADIAIREGKYDEALKHLSDAENSARIPQQQTRVIRGWINYYQARGQVGEILDLVDRLYDVGQAYMQPINLAMLTYVDYAYFYGLGAEVQRGIAVLTRLQAGFEPPLDTLVDVGFMLLWLADGNAEKARGYTEKVDAFLKLMQQEDLYYVSDMARARLAELDGDLDQAIEYDRKALERFSLSMSGTQEEKDRMRINLSLARYLIQAGRFDEAQAILDDYLQGNPAHPIANLELARLEHARGNIQQARDALQITLAAYTGADDIYPPAVEASRLAQELGTGL